MLRIRFNDVTAQTLGYSIERLADGTFYDFNPAAPATPGFVASPAMPIAPLPEGVADYRGLYGSTMQTPASAFPDGDYSIYIHDAGETPRTVIAVLSATIKNGDDATYFASLPGSLTLNFPAIPTFSVLATLK